MPPENEFAPPKDGRTACRKCGREMLFAHNITTGKAGPVDFRATVYVLRLDLKKLGIPAQTAGDFLRAVEYVRLKDGSTITPDKLRFYVSHFATCSNPELFSKRGDGS